MSKAKFFLILSLALFFLSCSANPYLIIKSIDLKEYYTSTNTFEFAVTISNKNDYDTATNIYYSYQIFQDAAGTSLIDYEVNFLWAWEEIPGGEDKMYGISSLPLATVPNTFKLTITYTDVFDNAINPIETTGSFDIVSN